MGWPSKCRASLVLGLQGTGKRKRGYMGMHSRGGYKNLGNDIVEQSMLHCSAYRAITDLFGESAEQKNLQTGGPDISSQRLRETERRGWRAAPLLYSSHPTTQSYARPGRNTCSPHERRRARSLCKVCSFMKRLDIVPKTASPKMVKNTPDKAAI